ncbi:hypothetical protein P43SY_001752 [Pythium insidiosum]|uniref:Uncharacterized protein n=1 Tax=Pythium insidiosum TaxID=114742 RepID=A0AAD5QDJ2_PYTIN|nr:hypothetical protein P43SY_001752 [Pythium insidiosum]
MFNFIADKLNVKNLGEMLAPTYTPEQELHASIEEGLQDKFFRLLDEQQVNPNEAKSMLPPGITPSIDPLAPRPDIAPPPLAGAIYNPTGPAPPQAPFNPLYAAPTHSAIPRGPAATRITRGEYRPIQADGFGTSVGNEELTAKYGNTREVKVTAPPPVLGGAPGPAPVPAAGPPAAPSEGANPYSAMGRSAPSPSAPYARGPYPGFAPGGATPPQSAGGAAPRGPPQFKIFNPKAVATNTTAPAATPVPGAYPGAPAPSGSPYGAAPAFGTAPAAAAAGGAATAPGGFETVPMDAEEVTLSASASVLQ